MKINLIFVNIFLLLVVTKEESYRRFHLYIEKFEHVTRRYPSHICCWEEADLKQCTNCGIGINLYNQYFNYLLEIINIKLDIIDIRTKYSFPDDNVFIPCLNISVNTDEAFSAKTIDLWNIKCLNLQPYEFYNVSIELGVFKNMKGEFSIWFECDGYAGINCGKRCVKNTRSFCDENGELKCNYGFTNPPECALDSPCSISNPCNNSGVCEALSTKDYICKCSHSYTGNNCENLRCDPDICIGKCENGECLCNADKFDSTCTTYDCNGNFLCRNGGNCGKINNEIFCVCPYGTTGTYCQFNCTPSCVHGKCQKDSFENDFCSCDYGYTGNSCNEELKILDPNNPLNNGNSGLNDGAIAGIIIAVLITAALIAVCGYFIYEKYRKQMKNLINNNLSKS